MRLLGERSANDFDQCAPLKLSLTTLQSGQTFTASAAGTDPDKDSLTWHWIVTPESAGRDAKGQENVPAPVPAAVVKSSDGTAELRAPSLPGVWRVFLRVTDGKGHAATANAPFQVK